MNKRIFVKYNFSFNTKLRNLFGIIKDKRKYSGFNAYHMVNFISQRQTTPGCHYMIMSDIA